MIQPYIATFFSKKPYIATFNFFFEFDFDMSCVLFILNILKCMYREFKECFGALVNTKFCTIHFRHLFSN